MKKTGKALSLVLSLALVASSIPMAFASAATPGTNDASGIKDVTLSSASSIALAVDTDKTATAPTGVELPTVNEVKITGDDGAVYDQATAADIGAATWSSSNSSVAKIKKIKGADFVIPVAKGTATLTCSVAATTLKYGDHTKTATFTKDISVTVYNKGDYVLTNDTTADMIVPQTKTKLAVNDGTTAYSLYKVTGDTTGVAQFGSALTKASDINASYAADDVLQMVSAKKEVMKTVKVLSTDATSAPVDAQTAGKVYLGSDQIIAEVVDKDGKLVDQVASLPVEVVKAYDATGASDVTISGSTNYGETATKVGEYDVTGYDINGSTATGKLILNKNANVGNVVAGTGEVDITGGSVGNVTSTGIVAINGGKVGNVTAATVTIGNTVGAGKFSNTTVGNVVATTSVAVTNDNDKVSTKVGNINCDGTPGTDAVTVDGKNTTVGDINAKGNITVGKTTVGATTGSLTGVPTYATPTATVTYTYPDVAVTGSTVNGNIVGHAITVAGSDAADADATAVPATVTGGITVYNTTTTSVAAGSVTVGDKPDTAAYKTADVTVGSITDAKGGAAITVQEGTNTDTKTKSTTTVGSVNGFKPVKDTDPDTTTLNFINFDGSFQSLPNFSIITVDGTSDVTVASPVTTGELSVAGKAELAGATVDTVDGTGTLRMPAGKLTVKANATGPINLEPTSAVKKGDVLFSGGAGLEDMVKAEGVTIVSKPDESNANAYDYCVDSVSAKEIALDVTTLKVPEKATKTLKVSVVPNGTVLPDGDKFEWTLDKTDTDNNYFVVTPSKDTMSADVKAIGYDADDTDSVNENKITVRVVDANGNLDTNFTPVSCNLTALAPVALESIKVSADTTDVTVEKPATLTVASDTPDAVLPDDAKAYAWTSDNDNFKVVPSVDGKTVTVSIAKAPEKDETAKITVTVAGKTATATVTAKAVLTGVTVSPATAEVKADAPATLTVAPNPANAQLPADAKITWASDNDNFTVTPSADGKTATVSVAKAPEKDTTADVTVKVNNFTATAKVTAKAATVPVVKPSNFTIDSMPKTMKLGQVYTVKINSKDGSKPNYAFANGFAVITKNVTKGNDTFLTFTARSTGDHGVYIGDKKVAIINVAGSICDTRTVTVKQGKVYQFKVTSRSTPVFTVATVGTLKPVRVSGHDYFYKVTATSNKGDHGVYVNGAKIAHCIFA